MNQSSVTLPKTPRLLVEATLRPVQGTRFQPTGFPDIGAGTYRLHDGTEMLLVESPQSLANRLEAVAWDSVRHDVVPLLEGMPYVRVMRDGSFLTSSILEAHRVNSAYIESSDGFDVIKDAIGHDDKKPLDRDRLVRALCRFDPASLLHGVFLESIAGTLRVARALSAFIEARDVQVVATGGVKNDRVMPSKDASAGATAKEGFGNVPFHRDEYTAKEIVAYFNVDLQQLRSYGLPDVVTQFLYALALWKIHAFLADGLRLRTACDLEAAEIRITRPEGYALPSRSVLEEILPRIIQIALREDLFLAKPFTVTYSAKPAKKSKEK